MRLEADANHSSEKERIWVPSGAETRSVVGEGKLISGFALGSMFGDAMLMELAYL